MGSHETIFALSSGRPPAGLAVVRISGPEAGEVAQRMAGRVPAPRRATRATLRDEGGAPLDDALILFFPAPGSATGEDVLEFHLHGGRAVVAAVLAVLARQPRLRLAEPGEFTRRAHANGKMDLSEAEGLGDLIAAETEAQRRQAMAQAAGALSRRVEGWRARLVRALMLVEAGVDFSDEGDVPDSLLAPARAEAAALAGELKDAIAQGRRGERVREGLTVAIAGPPNAGKSTLLNCLAGRDAAIVSAIPGTTRDLVEVHLDIGGQAVTLIDTAGLRETADEIEAEGVRRARARAAAADLVLWLSAEGARRRRTLPARFRCAASVICGRGAQAFPFPPPQGRGSRLWWRSSPPVPKVLWGENPPSSPVPGSGRRWKARSPICIARRSRRPTSFWRKTCASPPARWIAWWAGSMWRMCWMRCSAVSASASETSPVSRETGVTRPAHPGPCHTSSSAARTPHLSLTCPMSPPTFRCVSRETLPFCICQPF